MSLLKEQLFRFIMPDEVEMFFNSILEKIDKSRPDDTYHALKLDELYGILPGTVAARHGRKTADPVFRSAIEKWNLSEILTLKNSWDDMTAVLWKQDGHYYCTALQLFDRQWRISSDPIIKIGDAEALFPVAVRRFQLLSSAFGNTPLRQLGVRQYIHDILNRQSNNTERHFCLEFFLTLFQLELSTDELRNQDLFLERARLHFQSIVSFRSGCGVMPEFSRMAEIAAVRGSGDLFYRFYIPVNMVWGFLANRKVMNSLGASPEGEFGFYEYYDTKGNVELGEIFPAAQNRKSSIQFQHDRDCYIQVFHDYQTAQMFRSIALKILHSHQNGRKS